jgi:hypothetical protein
MTSTCSYGPYGAVPRDASFSSGLQTKNMIGCSGKFAAIEANTALVNEELRVKEVIDANNVLYYGAIGDGVANDTAAVLAALQSGQEYMYFPPGTYMVDQVRILDLPNNLHIKLRGSIKGTADPLFITSYVMEIRAPIGSTTSFSVEGPGTIDASNRDNLVGEGSGSGLTVYYFTNVNITDVTFTAGAAGDGKGDSGLVPLGCKNVVVKGCHFEGWEDHGIYATGPAVGVPTPALSFICTNSTFVGIGAGGVRLARNIKDAVIANNSFRDSNRAIQFGPGSTGLEPATFYSSAATVVVDGNVVSNMSDFGFDLRAFESAGKIVISNNVIVDWGTASLGNSVGINLRGVSNALVTGNVIRPYLQTLASTSACNTGIYIQTETLLGVTYPAVNNVIANNYIEILDRAGALNYGVYQANSTATNWYGPNRMVNAAPRDYLINNGGDVTNTYTNLVRQTATGTGFGGITPKGVLDVNTNAIVSFPGSTDRYIEVFPSFTHEIFSYSGTAVGRNFAINATTNSVNTAPSSGSCTLQLQSLGRGIDINAVTNKITVDLAFLSNFANDAAAAGGGVPVGGLYRNGSVVQVRVV